MCNEGRDEQWKMRMESDGEEPGLDRVAPVGHWNEGEMGAHWRVLSRGVA